MNEGVNGGVNERYGTQDAWHECGAKLGAFELDFGSILDRFWQKPEALPVKAGRWGAPSHHHVKNYLCMCVL